MITFHWITCELYATVKIKKIVRMQNFLIKKRWYRPRCYSDSRYRCKSDMSFIYCFVLQITYICTILVLLLFWTVIYLPSVISSYLYFFVLQIIIICAVHVLPCTGTVFFVNYFSTILCSQILTIRTCSVLYLFYLPSVLFLYLYCCVL